MKIERVSRDKMWELGYEIAEDFGFYGECKVKGFEDVAAVIIDGSFINIDFVDDAGMDLYMMLELPNSGIAEIVGKGLPEVMSMGDLDELGFNC